MGFPLLDIRRSRVVGIPPILYHTAFGKLLETMLLLFVWSIGNEFIYISLNIYLTRALITRGMYILNPLIEGRKGLFKGLFSLWSYIRLVFKSGFYSRSCYDGARTIVSNLYLTFLGWVIIKCDHRVGNHRKFHNFFLWSYYFFLKVTQYL